MRVVHIAHEYGLSNQGGAAIAASRLHRALLTKDVDSYYLTNWNYSSDKNVIIVLSGFWRKFYFYVGKLCRVLAGRLFTGGRNVATHLVPWLGFEKILKEINPDVVHVHWLNADVMSLGQLAKIKCPVVINLHDLYMINAIDPYPGKDERFKTGFDEKNSSHYERWIFKRKKGALRMLNIHFLGPSRWVVNQAGESLIGHGLPATVVPNIIDAVYEYDARYREQHNLFTVLYGAYGGRRNKLKGWDDLERSLSLLTAEDAGRVRVDVFGEGSEDYKMRNGVQVHFLGPVNDPKELMKIYHSVDAFAFPSREETQGMTKIEALLCGLPVLAFDRTACAEGIRHGENGWIADDGDLNFYAKGICHFMQLFYSGKLEGRHREIANEAAKEFDADVIVKKVMSLYDECRR